LNATTLTADTASKFAKLALRHVTREYPNKPDHVLNGPLDLKEPRDLHPVFFGSFDWHSCVHGYWLLATVFRSFPDIRESGEIRKLFDAQLISSKVEPEVDYLDQPLRATFERPYGWAWLLELQAELIRIGRWHDAAAPLAAELARRFEKYLRTSPYPVRAGTHGNTAFACVLALDYAQAASDTGLAEVIHDAARRWYSEDRDYPVAYEPSGDDFLSPALVEALLMKRVLSTREFAAWLERFLPPDLGPLCRAPTVIDHADAKQSHLDGLCLSRAWCFKHLGFDDLARFHLERGMPHVMGGDYAGEHWLASFATLALSAEALRTP
jgi:hypothetical protein